MRDSASRRLRRGTAGDKLPPHIGLHVAFTCEQGDQRMKLGITFYSFDTLLTTGQKSLDECMVFCAREGVEAVDMMVYYLDDPVGQAAGIKARLKELGLELAGYGVGNNLCVEGEAERATQVQMILDGIDAAAAYGATNMRVFGGHPPKGQELKKSMDLAVQGLKQVTDLAEERGVVLGLENHGWCPGTSGETLEIIERVGSRMVKPLIDTGNFLGADQDILEGVRELAKECIHVHVKDYLVVPHSEAGKAGVHGSRTGKTQFRMPRSVGEGSVDFKAVFGVLKEAGFAGSLSIEHESPDPSFDALATSIRNVRAARDSAEGE